MSKRDCKRISRTISNLFSSIWNASIMVTLTVKRNRHVQYVSVKSQHKRNSIPRPWEYKKDDVAEVITRLFDAHLLSAVCWSNVEIKPQTGWRWGVGPLQHDKMLCYSRNKTIDLLLNRIQSSACQLNVIPLCLLRQVLFQLLQNQLK